MIDRILIFMSDILFVLIVLGLLFFCAVENIKKSKKIRGTVQLLIAVFLVIVFLMLFGRLIHRETPPDITTAFPPVNY